MPILVAVCPEHGLHGQRTECFSCGGPVEQVRLFTEADVKLLMARGVARVQRASRDMEADMRRFSAKDAEGVLTEVLEEAKRG